MAVQFVPSAGPAMEGGGEEEEEESLFSLELLVESARVEPRLLPTPLPACGPFRPAVALRLLDFPTLLVRAPRAARGPLVPFGRGKSCLFRLRPGALRDLLRRSPLYALLLALPPTPPGASAARLLGSCSVSLAAAAQELWQGTGPGGRRGLFPLQDLMGEQVGELGLSYRLTNLGVSLLGHLGEGAAPQQQQQQLHAKRERRPEAPPTLGAQGSHARAGLELIPEGDEDQEPSSEESGSQGPLGHFPPPGLELGMEANVFCPPPMFYTCPTENPHPKPGTPAPVKVTVAPAQDSFPAEEIHLPSPVPLAKEDPASPGKEVPLSPRTFGSTEQLRQTLNQLPLLNALLVELSLLNKQPLQAQPFSVHPQLAWLYKNAEEGTKSPPPVPKSVSPYQEEKKTTHRKERGRSVSPKLKRNADHLKCISPSFQVPCPGKGSTKLAYSERLGGPEKNNTKENSPPRRKLTYGLTNTLRLRLLRSNPGMLKVHEKREHRRKKQGDIIIEKKSKSSSAKGKVLHGSLEEHAKSSGHLDEKCIPEEKVQINENVETLIQSSAHQDCPTSEKFAAKAVNGENGKENTSTEVVSSTCKEKSLKVHLPRVFLQNAETDKNKTSTEVVPCVPHSDSDASATHNDSQSKNCESSHELKGSEEVYANTESVAYSEDFTSDNSSVTNLEAQESSPESMLKNPATVLENLDQSQSIVDSGSKMSERSSADQSVSPPLPVPSAVSPVQYPEKTYDLKLDRKKLVVSFDKSIDDSPPARTLKEGLAVEQIRKERSKDEQALEEKEVSSDWKCSIANDLSSVEKSSSLRTSQVSSYLPSSISDLDLSGSEESHTPEKEKEDDFEMVDIANQCKHVSELVVNKLPGYTM